MKSQDTYTTMGYVPPKQRDLLTGGRIEFVMTRKGWHHCWDACVSSKKCKWLGSAPFGWSAN